MDGELKFWIISTFILGGTNLLQVIEKIVDFYRSRKKDRIERASLQGDVDDKEFETMRKQLEFQDKRLEDYERRMREKEENDDRMREELIAMKREKYDLENKYLKLERKYIEKDTQYRRDACMNRDCTIRVSPDGRKEDGNGRPD